MESEFIPPMKCRKSVGRTTAAKYDHISNAPFRNFKCPLYNKCIDIAAADNMNLMCNQCENKDTEDEDYRFW